MLSSCFCHWVLAHGLLLTVVALMGSWVNCEPHMPQSLRDKAKGVKDKVTDTVFNVISGGKSLFNKASGSLGPDRNEDECSESSSCPSTVEHEYVAEEGSQEEQNYELTEVDDEESGLFSQLLSIGSSSVATVYRTAKSNIYDNGAKLVNDFAEKVREIVHEEIYTFLQSTMSSLGDALLTPGATLYYLGQTAMTVSIVFICLLLTYLMLYYFSLLFIVAFNASVFLLHQVFGPRWIFDYLIWITSYAGSIVWFSMRHYYITSVLVVILFIYSIVITLIRRFTRRTQRQQFEMTVLDLSRRLRVLEDGQNEMLKILRRLDNDRREEN